MTCRWCDGTGRIGGDWYGFCICDKGDALMAEEQRTRGSRPVLPEDKRQGILPGINEVKDEQP